MKQEEKVKARKLKGFQDYLPDVMVTRQKIMEVVRKEASKAGFLPIATPALEYAEVLLGQGAETDKQIYRFLDNGKRDVGMRFDLTVPFARFVAENQGQLNFPFKRLQIGDVWRAEKPQKGRYREFCQCDLDIIGVDGSPADIEILSCFYNILKNVKVGPFTIKLGNRVVLSALITKCFPDMALEDEQQVLIVLDKLEKIGEEKVKAQLLDIPGGQEEGAKQLLELISKKEGLDTDLEHVKSVFNDSDAGLEELQRFQECVEILRSICQDGPGKFVVDLSIARGLGYYTGVVFESTLDRLPRFGSVASGGRYDNLAERFCNRHLPGVGGSLGLDRLVAGLIELDEISQDLPTKFFVAVANEDARSYGFNIANILRKNGIPCDISLKVTKLANQFKHANRLGCPFVITVGSEELEKQMFNLKFMEKGQEKKGIPLNQLADEANDALST